jgi:c-di-GMP-binding flagellar brake protein YcgR
MADVASLLKVNQKVQVKVAGYGREVFYSSRIEDLRSDRVAVATPIDGAGLVRLESGRRVWIVVAAPEAAFQVPGRVLGEILRPVPITWIGEFGEPERVQRRRFFRVEDPPVAIHSLTVKGTDSALRACRMLDLSAGGMLLEVPDKLSIGTVLQIDFSLQGAGRWTTSAEVVRTELHEDAWGTRYRYGCRFTSLTWKDEDAIIYGLFCFQRKLRQKGLR